MRAIDRPLHPVASSKSWLVNVLNDFSSDGGLNPEYLHMDPAARDALIARVRAGERDCYWALVEDLEHEVRGFVAAHATHLELVEEVVQAAFVEAYFNLARYEMRGTFASWVKGFARNLLHRELASRARLVSADLEHLESLLAGQAGSDLEDESAVDRRVSEVARVESCLQALSPRAQLLARRRFAEQVPVNVLARQFKQTHASIAYALSRIRSQLRACVEAAGQAQEGRP